MNSACTKRIDHELASYNYMSSLGRNLFLPSAFTLVVVNIIIGNSFFPSVL